MKGGRGSSEPLSEGQSALSSPLAASERWYVARSLPRQEVKAMNNLRRQGFQTFLPLLPKTVRHARKLRSVLSPVFPGYLFVILDLDRDRWRAVNSTIGVASLIMALERPEPVPAGVVEQLIDRTGAGGVTRFDLDLEEGRSVRLLSGPFANAIGCLERLDANGRVKVLLDIMGGKVSAYVDRSALDAA
ncbi:transcriptional activator RfaH [Methylocystis echinoides]|uniref:transcription termination/antitermination protein NusG n=1 Tax=Methylocystis echinoides TaxID=29468 RepID=UPI00342AAF8B